METKKGLSMNGQKVWSLVACTPVKLHMYYFANMYFASWYFASQYIAYKYFARDVLCLLIECIQVVCLLYFASQ